jgi:hypothetical protein
MSKTRAFSAILTAAASVVALVGVVGAGWKW